MVLHLLIGLVLFQLWYWWFYYYQSFKKYDGEQEIISSWPPVSIVICFKGLPENFDFNLDHIISQNYPEFELILVNDYNHEVDVSAIKAWKEKNLGKDVSIVRCTTDLPGKKHALTEGIATCRHELVLLTDIDCCPDSNLWIQKMTGNMLKNKSDIVLGYGPMSKEKGWVAWFSGFETTLTALQYFGHFFAGKPYMSVGRNWMIKKSVYLSAWQTSKGKNLASGDDDLVFQAALPHAKVSACLEKESFMFSKPKDTWMTLTKQKLRHITTAVAYPFYVQIILFLFAVSFPLYFGLLAYLFYTDKLSFLMLLGILLGKWSLQTFFHYSPVKKLDNASFLITYPFGEILLAFYFPFLSALKLFFSNKW